VRRLVLLLSCLLVTQGLLIAQKNDPHYATERIAPTVKRSAFVHGYLHGYEEGFHQADFDLQMGHISRGDYTRDASPTGYHKQFGSKHMYQTGYRKGFEVGYADAAVGRSFRAFGMVATLMAGSTMTGSTAEASNYDGVYDEGVMSGYIAGQHQGLNDARQQVQSRPSPACPVNEGKQQQDYCAAYASGYQLGYSDGFTNQAKTTVAEKR